MKYKSHFVLLFKNHRSPRAVAFCYFGVHVALACTWRWKCTTYYSMIPNDTNSGSLLTAGLLSLRNANSRLLSSRTLPLVKDAETDRQADGQTGRQADTFGSLTFHHFSVFSLHIQVQSTYIFITFTWVRCFLKRWTGTTLCNMALKAPVYY